MQRINILIIAVIILSVIFFQESGFAETFNVSTTQELRQALLDAATNGQDDIIILADGTYATTDDGGGTFVFLDNENYDLTLQGSSPENVILSGGNTHQILNARTVSIDLMTIKLKNLALKFGYSTESGGGIGTEEKLDIENCIIASNETTRHEGAFGLVI